MEILEAYDLTGSCVMRGAGGVLASHGRGYVAARELGVSWLNSASTSARAAHRCRMMIGGRSSNLLLKYGDRYAPTGWRRIVRSRGD